MLIEYYATEEEDRRLERALEHYHIAEWFNPEEGYYVLDTEDPRVITTMTLMGIELWVTDTELGWHEHAFGTKNNPNSEDDDK